MQLNIRTTCSLLLSTLAISCANDPEQGGGGKMTVTIGSEPEITISPMTAVDTEDGVTTRWVKGDKIALWAKNSAGEYPLEAHPFSMWHYNQEYNSARFTSTIAPMPEDTYVYYAASPLPKSQSGTQAIFEIPAIQNGSNSLACDVMIAQPMEGFAALQSGDNSELINLAFTHKVHVLKITIPQNDFGMPITRLVLTFPQPVTGELVTDISDPSAPTQIAAGGSKMLTLQFTQPVTAGDTVFAVIAPTALDAADRITIMAYNGLYESYPVEMPGKNYREGRTTPIKLTIPKMYKMTRLFFSLDGDGSSTLGEAINSFTLTAPADVDLGNGTNTRTFAANAENKYEIAYEGDFTDNISGKAFTVAFDSDNALVASNITMPNIVAYTSNTIAAMSVPYLMTENFSGASSFKGGGSTSGSAGGNDLSGNGLSGWVGGQRLIIEAGKCAHLRHYNNWGGPYHSRIDTAPITAIKEGKSVKLKVIFNCDWKKANSTSMKVIVGLSTATNLNSSISNGQTLTMADNQGASADNIPTQHTVTITSFVKTGRIAWKTDGNNTGMFTYDDIYLDNIQVQITK